MLDRHTTAPVLALAFFVSAFIVRPVFAATLEVGSDESQNLVTVRSVTLRDDGALAGTLVNRSDEEIRGVRVLVDVAFLWNDELHPGDDNPGRSVPITVDGPIAPHGTLAFDLRPDPPIPSRTDGRYAPSAHILAYTHIAIR